MADRGPGPKELIRKRITAEIKRLEFQIESQELEILEAGERIERLKENIGASHEAIEKQRSDLAALDKEKEETTDG